MMMVMVRAMAMMTMMWARVPAAAAVGGSVWRIVSDGFGWFFFCDSALIFFFLFRGRKGRESLTSFAGCIDSWEEGRDVGVAVWLVAVWLRSVAARST